MSEYTLDEPGFKAPGAPAPAPSSDSSVDNPPEVRHKCIACPRMMIKKTADCHTLFHVEGLIVMLIPVAKIAWSGRRRKVEFM